MTLFALDTFTNYLPEFSQSIGKDNAQGHLGTGNEGAFTLFTQIVGIDLETFWSQNIL